MGVLIMSAPLFGIYTRPLSFDTALTGYLRARSQTSWGHVVSLERIAPGWALQNFQELLILLGESLLRVASRDSQQPDSGLIGGSTFEQCDGHTAASVCWLLPNLPDAMSLAFIACRWLLDGQFSSEIDKHPLLGRIGSKTRKALQIHCEPILRKVGGLQGPESLHRFWFHIPSMATVSYVATIPQNHTGTVTVLAYVRVMRISSGFLTFEARV